MIETVGDLKKALEVFDPSSRIMTNFGAAGTYVPDNSPILDVKKSGATGIIYIKVPYKLVCSKCGKFMESNEQTGVPTCESIRYGISKGYYED